MISTICLILAQTYGSSDSLPAEMLDGAMKMEPEQLLRHLGAKWDCLLDSYIAAGIKNDGPFVPRSGSQDDLQRLVSCGFRAVPYLLKQLDSQEATKAILGENSFVQSFSFESYDPRDRKLGDNCWPTVEDKALATRPNYVIKRGDLAYYALGQIVNRWYGLVRFYPGAVYFSFASCNPNLAARARADWRRLTQSDLAELYLSDIQNPDSYARQTLAMAKFRSVFPKNAVEVARKCISNWYGREPVGRPAGSAPSIFQEIQPLACPIIDRDCYSLLLDKKRRANFHPDYRTTEYEILNYLALRPKYRLRAIEYAKKRIRDHDEMESLFAVFLKKTSSKK